MRKRFTNNGKQSYMYKKGRENVVLSPAYRRALKEGRAVWDKSNTKKIYNISTNRLNNFSEFIDRRFKKRTLKRKYKRLFQVKPDGAIGMKSTQWMRDVPEATVSLFKKKRWDVRKPFVFTMQSAVLQGVSREVYAHNLAHFLNWIKKTIKQPLNIATGYHHNEGDNIANANIAENMSVHQLSRINPYIMLEDFSSSFSFGGGCGRKGCKPKKQLTGDIFTFNLRVVESRRNDCGLDALRTFEEVDFQGMSNVKIRRRYNLKVNTPIEINVLKTIYKDYSTGRILHIITTDWTHWLKPKEYRYIFLYKGHYTVVESVEARGTKRKVLRELAYKIAQEPSVKKKKAYLKQMEKVKKTSMLLRHVKRGTLMLDFEARPSDYTTKIAKTTGRAMKDTLVCAVYKEYNAEKTQRISFKSDCEVTDGEVKQTSARKMLDWLKDQHRRRDVSGREYRGRSKGKHYKIFAHNGGNFDYYLLLKEMTEEEIQHCEITLRGLTIIGMEFYGHIFRDTCCFLQGSLAGLCDDFRVEQSKMQEFTLQSTGEHLTDKTLCFYKPELTFDQFLNLEHDHPEYWENYVEYCYMDCESLFEIWEKFRIAYEDIVKSIKIPGFKADKILMKAPLHAGFTISGAAKKLCNATNSANRERKLMMKQAYKFIDNDQEKYEFLCKFKRGGISHCHQPGTHLSAVTEPDITSQYPASMLYMKVPVGTSSWVTEFDSNRHGFYFVKNMKFPRQDKGFFKPICPVDLSGNKGSLEWDAEEFEHCYIDSEMIKYVQEEYGATFDVVRGLVSYRQRPGIDFFGPYVQAMFAAKAEQDVYKRENSDQYNPALRAAVKLFLNGYTGKLLEDPRRYKKTKVVPNDEATKFICGSGVVEVAEEEGKKKKKGNDINPDVLFGIMMYSYSKRLLFEYINCLPNRSTDVIHVETDGLFFNYEHWDTFLYNVERYVGDYPVAMGKQLGNLEVEYTTIPGSESIFISKKVYRVVYYDEKKKKNKEVLKMKGIRKKTLNPDGTERPVFGYETFKNLAKGIPQKNSFGALKKILYGKDADHKPEIISYTVTKTVFPDKRYTEEKGGYPVYPLKDTEEISYV